MCKNCGSSNTKIVGNRSVCAHCGSPVEQAPAAGEATRIPSPAERPVGCICNGSTYRSGSGHKRECPYDAAFWKAKGM